MTTNAVASYEFTMPECDRAGLVAALKTIAKKWVFQLEAGDTGYRHYQGRLSLIKKRRKQELIPVLVAAGLREMSVRPTTVTSLEEGDFYMTKLDTRLDGPWTSEDREIYIPRQYRDIVPYSWQEKVIQSAGQFDPRTVNYIYDPDGAKGKSTIAAICCLLHRGVRIPAVNDHEKLLASVCDILSAKEERAPGPIFIDLPRFMDKKRLHGIFSAIEEIKNGHCYDMRYHYKEWWFDSPPVWVFSNMVPDMSALSTDRWKVWKIRGNTFVPFVPAEED